MERSVESHAPSWYARSVGDALEALGVRIDRGLAGDDARRRLREHGPNRLRSAETRPWWRVLLGQFDSVTVYLLAAAAVLAFATTRWPEGVGVSAVIVVNTAIGFVSEWRAVRSMAALRERGEQKARVRRDGREREIEASDIVPGDVVLLKAGDVVPADLRLVEAERLRVDEAALTGESVPADKTTTAVQEGTDLAERRDMAYRGTSVAAGTAVGVAVATGARTELGRISELAAAARPTLTPLEKRLNRLGRRLAWLTSGIAVVVAGVGLLVRRQEAALVVETALALGIAAIPEGLPIVATVALARGAYLMARRSARVDRLAAVETLGATRVIFSDKTGTLTENRMRVRKIVTPAGERSLEVGPARAQETTAGPERREGEGGGPEGRWLQGDDLARRAMEVGVLCNAASLGQPEGGGTPRGDPTEIALLDGGRRLGIERARLLEDRPEVRVEHFDPRVRKMATFHERDGRVYVAVKGAPRAVLEVCTRVATDRLEDDGGEQPLDDETRREWLARSDEVAGEGLRLLAMADKHVDSTHAEPYEDLCFLGLVGLFDPPRGGVRAAIDTCQAAGIRVEMVTGDQPETARAIAAAVGIVGTADDPETVVMRGSELKDPDELDEPHREKIHRANIFARVSPEQKLNLVRIYQERGEIVAVTGDGVNDAPALKKADLGVAMGRRGTEAAKQAADMVLEDDAFETIVAAVEQGRVIFGNIRKSVTFMLCTNVAEVLAVTVATASGWTLPLRPLQILYLNVLTDVFPALALGVSPASGDEMHRPPRDPHEAVLTRYHWTEITGWATVIAACVLGGLLLAQRWLGLGDAEAVTVSFLTIAFGKLWFTFNLRSPRSGLVRNEVTRNPWVWAALGLCIVLLVAAVYLPGLSDLLRTGGPGWRGWILLLAMSVIPLFAGQAVREVQRLRGRRRG